MLPKTLTHNILIIKSIRYQTLNLFLDRPIKILQGIHNNPIFLALESFMEFNLVFCQFWLLPFFLVADFVKQLLEFLLGFRLQDFNCIDVFLFYEVFVD